MWCGEKWFALQQYLVMISLLLIQKCVAFLLPCKKIGGHDNLKATQKIIIINNINAASILSKFLIVSMEKLRRIMRLCDNCKIENSCSYFCYLYLQAGSLKIAFINLAFWSFQIPIINECNNFWIYSKALI